MLTCEGGAQRELREELIHADLVVVGGGMAGVCTAITAARAGIQVALVQDRPVLGGNASSEVRLWILGATSHGGNNNRWAREGGVIDEILVENCYRNPEGNPIILDSILLEKVTLEPNIRLLLNTSVHDLGMNADGTISSAVAFCSQNSTRFVLRAPLFCDASGDGIVAFQAGAAFRTGAESTTEFGELLAPQEPTQQLLGHSIYFYTRDTGKPVRFTPPAFALEDITEIPRYKHFNANEHGCELWWIEYGGNLDTVHDTEKIKWELWKVVYGVWNYIKNSGKFPTAESKTLEWIGTIPGKRESRRFEGDYMLIQQDIVEQRTHFDAVSFGGWAIDLHPSEGVYSEEEPCTQWHSKGVYQIPYRCLYSRTVPNLFLAGRIISASHIAFGSSRVMATCAHNGQAVGMAAAMCNKENLMPKQLTNKTRISHLQRELLRIGQWIPGVIVEDPDDLAKRATVTSSSRLMLDEIPGNGHSERLSEPQAVLLPVSAGRLPKLTFFVEAECETSLEFQLRACSRKGSFTPDMLLETKIVRLVPSTLGSQSIEDREEFNGVEEVGVSEDGANENGAGAPIATQKRTRLKQLAASSDEEVTVEFSHTMEEAAYVFCCLMANSDVSIVTSEHRITGVNKVVHRQESRVSKAARQEPPAGSGIESFEFWTPIRRPEGRNLAMQCEPALDAFDAKNLVNGIARPCQAANAWVADPSDKKPTLSLCWDSIQMIDRIELTFDTDPDHPMESVLMEQPETVMPCCVRRFSILGYKGEALYQCSDNHQTRRIIHFEEPVLTDRLTIEVEHPNPTAPASVFDVRCYGPRNRSGVSTASEELSNEIPAETEALAISNAEISKSTESMPTHKGVRRAEPNSSAISSTLRSTKCTQSIRHAGDDPTKASISCGSLRLSSKEGASQQ